MTEAEKVVMRDYWVNNFMEEELGYPLDLNKKIQDIDVSGASNIKYLTKAEYVVP